MGQGDSLLLHKNLPMIRIDESEVVKDTKDSTIQVIINEIVYQVTKDIPVETSLNTFIRNTAGLKGTKVMCHEGGCGVCIVTANVKGSIMAVNSCLIPILLCDGWIITTIEKIGNRLTGYHKLQTTLAELNGSHCGICSPGWIMSMFSILSKRELTMAEIENSLTSNLCRCTGYRPILDAFKSFGSDAPPKPKNKIQDIEDLYAVSHCTQRSSATCNNSCNSIEIIYESSVPRSLKLELSDSSFHKVLSIDEIFKVFKTNLNKSYILNGGNTSHGIYRNKDNQIIIDINDVPDLHRIEKTNNSVILGGNVTLTSAKIAFEKYASEEGFHYLKNMAEHIELTATIPIRNIGTLAGNLMMKNQHHEFPSDIFLILETAGAQLHILSSPGSKTSVSLFEFLSFNMKDKLIYSIVLPNLHKEIIFRTFKIMPRVQDFNAIVNAGFLFKLDSNEKVLEKPNIIFGGIKPDFLHATKTEEFLVGKSLYDAQTLKTVLKTLSLEIDPDPTLLYYKPEFLKLLSASIFYKFVLSINPKKVKPKLQSGGSLLTRGMSSGKQMYKPNPSSFPINQPIPNLDQIYQTSGECEYTDDIPIRKNEVFCAFTIAEAPGVIEKIEFEDALEVKGVINYLTSKDVPGKNTFINSDHKLPTLTYDEIFFADKEISYAGQIYGVVVAESQSAAQNAASKIKITYSKNKTRKAIIKIRDVIDSKDSSRILQVVRLPAKQPLGTDNKFKISGNFECGSQYHFTMETQSCVCVPVDGGMDVFSSTQWTNLTQTSIASLLSLPANRINVKVKKIGGSFGSRISRATKVACACALACFKTSRPARLVLPIEDDMRAMGKRNSCYAEYELAVDSIGRIQYLNMNCWINSGSCYNESCAKKLAQQFNNCYNSGRWSVSVSDVKTDLPSNTRSRASGALEGIAIVEHIMEHIARVIDKDPLDIRMLNMSDSHANFLSPMISDMKNTADYELRLESIERYNYQNRWKKRGLSMVVMAYRMEFFNGNFHALVSVCGKDGAVSISHSGIDSGEGLDTKVTQVAAKKLKDLKADIKMIKVQPFSSIIVSNDAVNGDDTNIHTSGQIVMEACSEIVSRFKPFNQKLGKDATWERIVSSADAENVELCVPRSLNSNRWPPHTIYGVAVSEVEIDALTGQHVVRRVDIIEDAGEVVLNPMIDVGQVEGAFVMGMGYWTCEDLVYDSETGGLKNFKTWNYKIPGVKDIPEDFRISFAPKNPNSTEPNQCGVEKSKAISEPPTCLSCSIPLAIREAINAARADAGNNDAWYQLDNAVTAEKILFNTLTKIDDMIL